jgi:hypothetical protein
MKTTSYNKKNLVPVSAILSVFLGLQATFTMANNSATLPTSRSDKNLLCISCQELSPVAPAEATFDDSYEDSVTMMDFSTLAPETPAEATFTDDFTLTTSSLINQATGKPVETDNNYSVNDLHWDLSFLAPVAPGEADFE